MTFIREKIAEQDLTTRNQLFDLFKAYNHYGSNPQRHWTIDRERELVLFKISSPVMEEKRYYDFGLVWQGLPIYIKTVDDNPPTDIHIPNVWQWRIGLIVLPNALTTKQQQVTQFVVEALMAFGEFSIPIGMYGLTAENDPQIIVDLTAAQYRLGFSLRTNNGYTTL